MADWLFKRDPTSKMTVVYSDAQLASFVSLGTVSGMEMVRAVNAGGDWVSIHTLPWFREVAKTPADQTPEQHAFARHRFRGGKLIGTIVGLYGGFAATASLIAASGPSAKPAVAVLTLGLLGAGIVTAVRRAMKNGKRAREAVAKHEGGPTPVIAVAQTPVSEASRDELAEQLAGLTADLELASATLRARVDVSALRSTANALRDQRAVLQQMLANDPQGALEVELAAVKEQAKSASDPSLIDALADQARTLESRIVSLDNTRRAALENEARQRALVHGVASLRLEIAQARVDVSLEDRTIDRLSQLKQQLEDEARIGRELDETVKNETKLAQRRAIGPA